jgi:hypothetical protein
VPNLVESFRKIAKDEAAKFFFGAYNCPICQQLSVKEIIGCDRCMEWFHKLIKWFENYLFKRRQKVINKNSWSSFEPVSAGVPQGSVLDPSCFLKENSMLSMLPVLEKNKISVFSGLNDISHLLDQAFSSSRS